MVESHRRSARPSSWPRVGGPQHPRRCQPHCRGCFPRGCCRGCIHQHRYRCPTPICILVSYPSCVSAVARGKRLQIFVPEHTIWSSFFFVRRCPPPCLQKSSQRCLLPPTRLHVGTILASRPGRRWSRRPRLLIPQALQRLLTYQAWTLSSLTRPCRRFTYKDATASSRHPPFFVPTPWPIVYLSRMTTPPTQTLPSRPSLALPSFSTECSLTRTAA